MNNNLERPEFNQPYVDPDTIQILGILGSEEQLQEADVIFNSNEGKSYYITVESADHYASDLIESAESINSPAEAHPIIDQFQDNIEYENKNFVWNDKINPESISKILGYLTVDKLKPFIIEVSPDEE